MTRDTLFLQDWIVCDLRGALSGQTHAAFGGVVHLSICGTFWCFLQDVLLAVALFFSEWPCGGSAGCEDGVQTQGSAAKAAFCCGLLLGGGILLQLRQIAIDLAACAHGSRQHIKPST